MSIHKHKAPVRMIEAERLERLEKLETNLEAAATTLRATLQMLEQVKDLGLETLDSLVSAIEEGKMQQS